MTTIEVIIPKGGTPQQPIEPILTPHYQAISRNQMIAWRFYTDDPALTKVKVEFTAAEAEFFPNTMHPTWVEQDVIFRKHNDDDGVKYAGQSLIWGEAPNYDQSDDKPSEDKYTVQGLNAAGQVLANLDPYIITTKPRPKGGGASDLSQKV